MYIKIYKVFFFFAKLKRFYSTTKSLHYNIHTQTNREEHKNIKHGFKYTNTKTNKQIHNNKTQQARQTTSEVQ